MEEIATILLTIILMVQNLNLELLCFLRLRRSKYHPQLVSKIVEYKYCVQAELIALRESVKFPKNLTTDQIIKIHVDNRASIQAVSNLKTPNKIAREISRILLDHSNMEITWIKARVCYKGNEVADSLAKQAIENGIP
ncbi:hypothetical protein AVEN_71330-1 [Araneus ventricosus]|uniref:Uncharacterized protein n=1 Tax=Araneus ventricosus TaxID=182803 RepID=A0A4Y2BIW6_ARAVE|nr:hypothetical protein AVEN_71330-1 [Araneus ventricosus]